MLAVVIPTIRSLDKWLAAWNPQLKQEGVKLYVVEDRDEKELSLPLGVNHYCRQDIHNDLGDKAWIISTFNSGIRSYGFYKAWQDGADAIMTLDDDCYPVNGMEIALHLVNLVKSYPTQWMNTLNGEHYVRGFPYGIRKESKVMLSHGLWKGSPDFDAPTELQSPQNVSYPEHMVIPKGVYFPMCIMNVCFRKELIPAMYQLLQGKDWEYDRFDDIWSGLIVKKIMDHLGYAVHSGKPYIEHRRQSNTFDNLIKEAKGIKRNETFWKEVDAVQLTKTTAVECYQEFWEKFEPEEEYFKKLKEAALLWVSLFQ